MPTSRIPQRRRTIAEAGLTLIEVIIAIGVIAIVMIPLIGLIASGQMSYRQAIQGSVAAVIVQNIRSVSAGITNTSMSTNLYFTDQGTLLTSSNNALWKAVITSTTSSTIAAPSVLVNKYSIIYIPGGQTNYQGFIHIVPR